MTTATAAGLTPDLFGYVQCARCGTWRPRGFAISFGEHAKWYACTDTAWCSKAAAAVASAKTGLDPNGDAV